MDGDVAVLDCLLEIRAFNPDLLACTCFGRHAVKRTRAAGLESMTIWAAAARRTKWAAFDGSFDANFARSSELSSDRLPPSAPSVASFAIDEATQPSLLHRPAGVSA